MLARTGNHFGCRTSRATAFCAQETGETEGKFKKKKKKRKEKTAFCAQETGETEGKLSARAWLTGRCMSTVCWQSNINFVQALMHLCVLAK
jgi:hypothetical protein